MSKAKGSGSEELSSLTKQITEQMGRTRPRDRPMPAPTQLVNFSADYRKTVEELAELKQGHAGGFTVALENLRSSPYQLGPLDDARVQALVENLRTNPLTTPVVVRATEESGVFELVAGHHRAEAFRRLERLEIQAVAAPLDDDQAERLVFYDNLLAPSLCDFDKYLGFSQRRKSKGLSQDELAVEAGVSQQLVSALLAFDKLPLPAQSLIRANPKAATSRLFRDLAGLADAHPERVTAAVEKVLKGELAVTAAQAFVLAKPAKPAATVQKVVIKQGKRVYAELRRREGQLVVNFVDSEEAASLAEELTALLKARAAQGPKSLLPGSSQ